MNYYMFETLIRERMEEVERRSRLAWMFEAARADIGNPARAVACQIHRQLSPQSK